MTGQWWTAAFTGLVISAVVSGILVRSFDRNHEADVVRQATRDRYCAGFQDARQYDVMSDADRVEHQVRTYGWIEGGCWRFDRKVAIPGGHKLVRDLTVLGGGGDMATDDGSSVSGLSYLGELVTGKGP